jgi:uncharacterized small protein (DUF1192 family)
MKLNFIRDLILSIIEKQLAPLYSTKAELLLAREELDDYIGETDKIIEELEAQKKKYSNSNGAARVLFYFGEKEIISMFQKVTQPLPLASVSFKDVLGNAAKVDGVPAWSVTDSTLGTLAVSEDGMSAQFTATGPLGKFKFQVKADADLGAGIVEIFGESEEIELIAGDASVVEIKIG